MDFLTSIRFNFEKLSDFTIVTKLWKEIINGKPCEVLTDQIIEYSFHYPVDTEVYLEELNIKFDDCFKEELRTVDGSLKAYLVTFLYYCTTASDRVSLKTALNAAKLYMKIILLPSGLGRIYYEKNMYRALLELCIIAAKDPGFSHSEMIDVLELIKEYCTKNQLLLSLFKGTANMFSVVIMYTSQDGLVQLRKVDGAATCGLVCLKGMIMENEHPRYIRAVMESILRCLRSKPFEKVSEEKQRNAISIFKRFIKEVLLENLDQDKLQYLLDAFFVIWGKSDFHHYEDSVIILNNLNVNYYKELIRRLPNYLISKNHKKYYANIMKLVYEMIVNLPSFELDKLDVFFTCCLKNILMHVLNKNKTVQDKAVDTLANIFLLDKNKLVQKIFELYGTTGKFATLSLESILRAFCDNINDKFGGATKHKNILIIVSKLLIHSDTIDGELASKTLQLLCKDCTPFSLKAMLPNLHKLFLHMSLRKEEHICRQILRILYKSALHQDASSAVFLEHIYNSLVSPCFVDGVEFPTKCYSNYFLTDNFEYKLLFNKCQRMIRYDHVLNTINSFDYNEPGHSMLLNCLLDFVPYKETDVITDYIIFHFPDLCSVECVGVLFHAYRKILRNKGSFRQEELPELDVLHALIWDALYQLSFIVCNIKNAFELIHTLRDILKLDQATDMQEDLLKKISEIANLSLVNGGSNAPAVMHLTELCLVFKKMPTPGELNIFEAMMQSPLSMNQLKTGHKKYLIQMMSFFTTMAIINRSKVPLTLNILEDSLNSDCVVVKITAIKLLYSLCTEITHEFEAVVKFVFKEVLDKDPCLSRLCITIMEELIHDNYILLTAEDFLKFVYRLGCQDLHVFMRHTLDKRFMLSNKNDISKYYMSIVVYISGYTKFDNYRVPTDFMQELQVIRGLIECPIDIFSYLFKAIPIKTKFNIFKEMASIFDNLMLGQCKVDETFFQYSLYCLDTFKIMTSRHDSNYNEHFYSDVCKQIEKQMLAKDSKNAEPSYYGEYEYEIRKCTLTLLKLLFFVEHDQRMSQIKFKIFDTLFYWIEHVKPEIVHYIHNERGKEYDIYLPKLVVYFKRNRDWLENLRSNQERLYDAVLVE